MKNTVSSANFWIKVQAVSLIALLLCIALLAFFGWQAQQSLCTFRNDIQLRYENGVIFLEKHPEGIPGFSTNDILLSLDNQRRTLDSLQHLYFCGGVL